MLARSRRELARLRLEQGLLGSQPMAFQHEILVELFRTRPALALELLHACAGIDVGPGAVELGTIDLSQVASIEFRADAVTVVRDDAGKAVSAVIVEVQRRPAARKRRSWPVYVTALRARMRCPVTLLVLAPEPAAARWARRPIEIGHPGFCLTPIVVSYADTPRITDPAVASRAPELMLLSALAHQEAALAAAMAAAIGALPADAGKLYLSVITAAWPADASKILENHMTPKALAEIDRLNFERGVERGIEQGIAAGRADALRTAALELARGKLGAVTATDELAIMRIETTAELTALVLELGRAAGPSETQCVLDKLRRERPSR
jgi:hypothetical protein